MSTAEIALIVSIGSGIAGGVGVVNSARALRWQKRRDAERRERHVAIHFGHAAWHDEASTEQEWFAGRENLPLEYRLQIIVHNESEELPVYVRAIHIQTVAQDEGFQVTEDGESATRLEPGEPMVREAFLERIPIDFTGGVIAQAHIAPDDWIDSEPEPLLDHLLEHIAEHNSRGRLDAPPDT
jgi:hypothetical protein